MRTKIWLLGFASVLALSTNASLRAQGGVVPTAGADSTLFQPAAAALAQRERAHETQATILAAPLQRSLPTVNSGDSDADVRAKLADALSRLQALEQLRRDAYVQNIERLEQQYEMGRIALLLMAHNTDKLKVLEDALSIQADWGNLTNPMNAPTFSSAVTKMHDNLPNGAARIPFASASSFSNPFLSAAWSVGSLLFSRISDSDRTNNFDAMCVVNFATESSQEKAVLDGELESIRAHAAGLQMRLNEFFSVYARRVGYTEDFSAYQLQSRTDATDPIRSRATLFFSAKKSASLIPQEEPADIKNIRFDIATLRQLITDYDAVLSEADSYLGNVAATVHKQKGTICAAIPSLGTRLQTLEERSRTAQMDFRRAYMNDFGAGVRAALFSY